VFDKKYLQKIASINENMMDLAKNNKQRIYEFVKETDQFNKIDSIFLNYEKIFRNEDKIFCIPGYINGDHRLSLEINFVKKDSGEMDLKPYTQSLMLRNYLNNLEKSY
jgi:hypothetical protein